MKYGWVSELDGVKLTRIKSVSDVRGTLLKFHPPQEFENFLDSMLISINPNPGTIRGLHFQVEPFAEVKLVTCIQGAIFDVALDIRPDSRTFGMWTSFELSAKNGLQACLPKGIAHGFQTTMRDSIVHYSLNSSYSPDFAYSINPIGEIDFNWPLTEYSISERDSNGVSLLFAAHKYSASLKR